jgi:hypothetical protein
VITAFAVIMYMFLVFFFISEVLSGAPQGSALGPLLFSVFVKDLCLAVAHSKYLHFVNDLKIYQAVISPQDRSLLQFGINYIQGWCTAIYMKLYMSRTKLYSSPGKLTY